MTGETLRLPAPAKVNLSLDITGKLPNGYHTLRSVFQAIDIYDILTLTKTEADTPLTLTCSEPEIPCDHRNLVYRAAMALLGDTPCGLHIHLEKQIPSQAGMGGGSSDCAAALLGIFKLFALPLTAEDLRPIAAKLGADVPFFLYGGTALVEGIGERLTLCDPMPTRILLMAKGKEGVSTPEGYRRMDALTIQPEPHTDAVLQQLTNPDANAFFAVCGNAFDAVTDLAEVEQIRAIMRQHGIRPVLSGSGAAVFGGCVDMAQAERCAADLQAAKLPFVRICHTIPHGIQCQYSYF